MNSPKLLNTLLTIDAATCAAMGSALLVGSGTVAALTEIPQALLFWAGAGLLPIAIFMALVGRAEPVPGWAAKLIVLGNMAWILASLLLPASGIIVPNALGWTFLVSQACVVAILTCFEFAASRERTIAA